MVKIGSIVNCNICLQRVIAESPMQRYCSKECARKGKNKITLMEKWYLKNRQKPKKEKYCVVCKKQILDIKSGSQKVCENKKCQITNFYHIKRISRRRGYQRNKHKEKIRTVTHKKFNYKGSCEKCGKQEKLQHHHTTQPYEVNKFIDLCHECHKKAHNK